MMASAEYQRAYYAKLKAEDPEKLAERTKRYVETRRAKLEAEDPQKLKEQQQKADRKRYEKLKSQLGEEKFKERHREAWLKREKSMSDEVRLKRAEQSRVYAQNARMKIFALLGNVCSHCGFSDVRALQVDHIEGGGTQERKATSNSQLLKLVRNGGKEKYQILCANCNQIKRHENGEFRQRK